MLFNLKTPNKRKVFPKKNINTKYKDYNLLWHNEDRAIKPQTKAV